MFFWKILEPRTFNSGPGKKRRLSREQREGDSVRIPLIVQNVEQEFLVGYIISRVQSGKLFRKSFFEDGYHIVVFFMPVQLSNPIRGRLGAEREEGLPLMDFSRISCEMDSSASAATIAASFTMKAMSEEA